MKKKLTAALMAALMVVVAIISVIAGHTFVAATYITLLALMGLEKLNRRYGWSLAVKIYILDRLIARLKRKEREDLTTFMEERHKSGVDRITKVR